MKSADEARAVLARCIDELEARTRAEVMLAVRNRSGSYRDLDFLFASGLCFFAICLVLFSPWAVPAVAVPLPLLLLFIIGAVLSQRLGMAAPFASRKRKRHQVDQAV